jgi:hypothetical protein
MQFGQMQFRAVAFVLAEAILRKTRAKVAHNRVSSDFGNHTRGGNAETEAIAVYDRRLRQGEGEDRETVDQHMVGLEIQRADRRAHRLVGGSKDIDGVDLG